MAIESKYIYGGSSDIGLDREVNEDYFVFHPLSEDVLLTVVADGMGSKPSDLQPAAIATVEVVRSMQTFFDLDEQMVLENPTMFLKAAMLAANRVLGAFKMANEERYAGFGCVMSCVLLYNNTKIAFAHCGNTRISTIRVNQDGSSKIMQMTQEQTKAMELFKDGVISADDVPVHPGRFELTSGLGFITDPDIQCYTGKLKVGDIVLITTKGIHYGIRPDAMSMIVLQSENWETASLSLIQGAKQEEVPDNLTAALLYIV